MLFNRNIKGLIILLILIGFTLSLIIFVSLFNNSIELDINDIQDDIIPQHYNLEFIDYSEHMICHVTMFFQLTQNRYRFSIMKTNDQSIEISSINLYQQQNRISIKINLKSNQLIIKKNNIFHLGNYSLSFLTHINISNTTIQSNFIRQYWSSKYRILFTTNYLFPFLSHSFYRSTFNLNIISNDSIISNLPLNQISSSLDISQIAFALLHQYECRSIDIVQLCFPYSQLDFFSYLFNYILNTIKIFETDFSHLFAFNQLTLITVLEFHDQIIFKPGLIFLDQNYFLINTSVEQIIQQHELIFFILAYQWIDGLIQFDRDHKWLIKSLAKTIANYLFNQMNELNENNNLQIERFISAVIIDSLCNINQSIDLNLNNNILMKKSEAFLTEYRLYIGDNEFHSRIQQLIQYSRNNSIINQSIFFSIFFSNFSWSNIIFNHSIIFLNSSILNMYLFKFNFNCSKLISFIYPIIYRLFNNSSSIYNLELSSSNISTTNLISFNPFIHIFPFSWNHLIDELKLVRDFQQLNFLSKILFDSFLFNLANQISIEYPLKFIYIFFQQSFTNLTKNDLLIIQKIFQWYQSILSDSLKEKFVIYLQKLLHPFCLNNQLWTKQILINKKYFNQQIINEILLELCCSINHSICLQQISIKNDPQILIEFLFNNQQFDSMTKQSQIYQNQTDMLTSFNQLRIPSLFAYSDRIILNIICQIVRQQNEIYWYEFIHLIQQIFQFIPSIIITGLSCAIRTQKQIDYYLINLCPPSPFKWSCYRNILMYSSIKIFDQLNTIDNEQWTTNIDELVDFLFHFSIIQGNFSSHPMVKEFQSFILTWLTTNQHEVLYWLDNQNAYLI